jgi:hypothetical protein
MTEALVTAKIPSRPSLRVRYRLTPWWVKVLVIFAASRVITTIILLVFASIQAANPWTGAHPDYFSFAQIWDGTWYRIVEVAGYPSSLPVDAAGNVEQNAWAFLPVYPFVARVLMTATALPFDVVGVIISVLCAAGASLVFYKLLVPQLPSSTALFAVVLFCVAPLSPIYQVDYAEAMELLFLAIALLYLQRRRYWTMLPFVAVMAFTRPSGLAFALALGLHVIYRWVVRKRDPFPPREIFAAISAGIITALLGYAWPFIAGVVTGVPDAYVKTELSWRADYIGFATLVPFKPWIQGAIWWMGRAQVDSESFAVLLLVIAVVAFAVLMFSPWVKRIGVDLRLWVASWTIYLLAVFFPQSSVFRMFVPAFPLLGAIAVPTSKVYRAIVVAFFIAGQVVWVWAVWWFSSSADWTPP